jgi:hypothetical protein
MMSQKTNSTNRTSKRNMTIVIVISVIVLAVIVFLYGQAQCQGSNPARLLQPVLQRFCPSDSISNELTLSPLTTDSTEAALMSLIDDFYTCINQARRDTPGDYQACWNMLSDRPGEYQESLDNFNNGKGFETFYVYWNELKIGYAIYYCQINDYQFVDTAYKLYPWNDMSMPINNGETTFIEYSFGLDSDGYRIKSGYLISAISSYCHQSPGVEKWLPAP